MKRRATQPTLVPALATIKVATVTRPSGHLRIRAGGRTLATLHPTDAEQLALHTGDPLTSELEAALTRSQARTDARRAALRLLARRAISAEALRDRLLSAEHASDAVDDVIRSLRAAGALNDQALADSAAARARSRHLSTSQAIRDLTHRGLPEPVARRAVARAAKDATQSDRDLALTLARSRLRPSLRSQPRPVQFRRLAALLARRGHDESTIESVLNELLGGTPTSD